MMGVIPIGEAMASPKLMGAFYAGESWFTWKAATKAAFAEHMTAPELEAFQSVAGGRKPPGRRVSVLSCVCGRGAGKDAVATGIAAHLAATFDGRGKLRPGERAVVLLIAVDRAQAAIAFGYLRGLFEQVGAYAELVESIDKQSIRLSNHVDIVVATNSFRAVRGRSLLAVIMDEAAFYRDESSATPDVELYNAVKPGLARVPGSMLIVISSVYRRSGLLHELYKRHYGRDDDEVLVVFGGTRDFNPTFPQEIIDKALAEDPQLAGAEYLSRWRDDLSTFISRELIEAAIDPGVRVRPPVAGQRSLAFCDGSGGVHDSFTAAVAHREGAETIVLDLLYERRAPFNPTEVVAEIADTIKPYGVREITGDRYSASWVVEAFKKVGLRYVQSERDRSAIYMDALPLFTAGRARLIDNSRLVKQFTELERRTFPTGRDRIDHPTRGNAADDLCNSAAGALVLAASRRVGFVISDEIKRRAKIPDAQHAYLNEDRYFR